MHLFFVLYGPKTSAVMWQHVTIVRMPLVLFMIIFLESGSGEDPK